MLNYTVNTELNLTPAQKQYYSNGGSKRLREKHKDFLRDFRGAISMVDLSKIIGFSPTAVSRFFRKEDNLAKREAT